MSGNNVLLTVIITVYNIAPYISKCIESVIRQTYENMEILVIDDGSTDNSGSICDTYALKDKRVKVYHQQNQGLVLTRKFGVETASGEIVTFVDGDDWIEPDMYEHMVAAYVKGKSEMVTSGLIYERTEGKVVQLDGILSGTYEKDFIHLYILPRAAYDMRTGRQGITASVCNKLFNCIRLKEVIKNIDSQLTMGEDGAIVYNLLARVGRITVINQPWYHYVQRENSMVRSYDAAAFEKLIRLKEYLVGEYKKLGIENKMIHQIDYYVKVFLGSLIENLYGFGMGEDYHRFPYEDIPKNSRIILYGAGNVGCSYWKSMQSERYAEVIGWVDRNYKELQKIGYPTESLENIISKKFDYIVIAIEDKETAEEVKQNIVRHGIREEKIKWKEYRI